MNLKSSNIVCNCYSKRFFFKDFFFTCGQTLYGADEQQCDWLISFFTCIRGVYKPQAWCSLMLQLLLFQSTERVLIDVESVRVATIGMEEILKLLTERDIEHTNNLPLLFSSYLHLPVPKKQIPPSSSRQYFSVSGSLSPYIHHISLYKSVLYPKDASIYSKTKNLSSCLHKTSVSNASWSFQSYVNKVYKYKMVYAGNEY